MKTEMSSRERLLAAFRRQPHDRVPFSPYIGQGPWWEPPLYWRDQFERADRMLELGLDPTIDIWLPDPQPHPEVEVRTWRDTSGPEPLLTKEYSTPAGVLRQTARESEDWCSPLHGPWVPTTFGIEKRTQFNMDLFDDHAVSRRTEPWVEGEEDLEKLRYLIRLPGGHALDEWRMDAERAREMARQRDVVLQARRTITGDAFMWFCDIADFAIRMIEQPEFVREFLGIFEEWAEGLTRLALEAEVDVVQHRGWYEIPTYWGVGLWRQYIMPFVQRQARIVHEARKLHSYLLPEGYAPLAGPLAELETDVLFALDPRKLHGGDLGSLFEKLGEGKCFWGGVNAEVTVAAGSDEEIEAEVREAVEKLDGNDGLVVSALLFSEVPTARILKLVEAWRRVAEK